MSRLAVGCLIAMPLWALVFLFDLKFFRNTVADVTAFQLPEKAMFALLVGAIFFGGAAIIYEYR